MSLVPTPTYSAPDVPLYVSASAIQLPVGGSSSNLTFFPGFPPTYPEGSYHAYVPAGGGLNALYGVNSNSVVAAELRSANAVDSVACWVVWAKYATTSGGSIQVVVAAAPTEPLAVEISWSILQI